MEPISIEEIVRMDLKTAYKLFIQLEHEIEPETRKKYRETYQKVRFGIELKFDIYTEFNEFYTPKQKSGKIIVENKELEIWEYYTELEERETTIKKFIIESGIETDIIQPR